MKKGGKKLQELICRGGRGGRAQGREGCVLLCKSREGTYYWEGKEGSGVAFHARGEGNGREKILRNFGKQPLNARAKRGRNPSSVEKKEILPSPEKIKCGGKKGDGVEHISKKMGAKQQQHEPEGITCSERREAWFLFLGGEKKVTCADKGGGKKLSHDFREKGRY